MFEDHLLAFDRVITTELDRCVAESPVWKHILTILSCSFYFYDRQTIFYFVAADDPERLQTIWKQVGHILTTIRVKYPFNFLDWMSMRLSNIGQVNLDSISIACVFLNTENRAGRHFVDEERLRETSIYLLDMLRNNQYVDFPNIFIQAR